MRYTYLPWTASQEPPLNTRQPVKPEAEGASSGSQQAHWRVVESYKFRSAGLPDQGSKRHVASFGQRASETQVAYHECLQPHLSFFSNSGKSVLWLEYSRYRGMRVVYTIGMQDVRLPCQRSTPEMRRACSSTHLAKPGRTLLWTLPRANLRGPS